ncbi:MAG: hypothetical protein NVV82_00390 [Sporocytophaga sp.]|nr:hypothetical protein [Sporocytophaga sp.]
METNIKDFINWIYKEALIKGGYENKIKLPGEYVSEHYNIIKRFTFKFDKIAKNELDGAPIEFVANVAKKYFILLIKSPLVFEGDSNEFKIYETQYDSLNDILNWLFIDGLRKSIDIYKEHQLIYMALHDHGKTIPELEEETLYGPNFFKDNYMPKIFDVYKLVMTYTTTERRVGKDDISKTTTTIKYIIYNSSYLIFKDEYLYSLIPNTTISIESDYTYGFSSKPYYSYRINLDQTLTDKFHNQYDIYKHYEHQIKSGRVIKKEDDENLIKYIKSLNIS